MQYWECDPEGWHAIWRRWQRNHPYEPMSQHVIDTLILALAFAGYCEGESLRAAEKRQQTRGGTM
jgi:hypothetical protein